MPSIADPVTFPYCGLTAPTSTLKSAMTERLCSYDQDHPENRGKVSPEYIKSYEEWGQGKIGVIVLGNIPIDYEALEAQRNIVIDERSSFDPVENLRDAIKAAKSGGSIVVGQLTHGGRQTSVDVTGKDKRPVSASDVQAPDLGGMHFNQPRPLTVEEIKTLVQRWAYGAEVLHKAGADGMQLHGAHGYLLSQFLSARTNKRTDDYGGNFENRSRIVFEILDEIKSRLPKNFLLSMKLNSADFTDGGMTEEESGNLCERLDEYLDLIELSGGHYESSAVAFSHQKESTKKREGYFVEFADNIRPRLKKAKLATTGGFRSKAAMNDALKESVHLVGLARPLTAEPHLIRDMIDGKTEAAKENLVPSALQTPAAVAQIGAFGKGQAIPDLSKQDVVDELVEGITGQPSKKPDPEQNVEASYEKGAEK